MKKLLSVLALLGVIACSDPAQVRFVNTGHGQDGDHTLTTMVWQTATARDDCVSAASGRISDGVRSIMNAAEHRAFPTAGDMDWRKTCAPFTLGEIPRGTKVAVLGECGKLTKVRILDGALQGKSGCVEPTRLSESAG